MLSYTSVINLCSLSTCELSIQSNMRLEKSSYEHTVLMMNH